MSARRRERSIFLLRSLLGDAQHGADLGPASAIVSGHSDGADQVVFDFVALGRELGDCTQRSRIGELEICRVYALSPIFELCCTLEAGLCHCDHQPFRNFCRAGIA